MRTTRIQTNETYMSLDDYGDTSFPVGFYLADFTELKLGHINWHWHRQVQLSYVLRGEVECSFENKQIALQEGTGVFINSNTMHKFNALSDPEETALFSVIWDSNLLVPSKHNLIFEKYVSPLLNNPHIPMIVLQGDTEWQTQVLALLREIHQMEGARLYGFELIVHNYLCSIWQHISLNVRNSHLAAEPKANLTVQTRIKRMMLFIQEHYAENLSLQTIADSANVSKSECVRCFRKCLDCSPIEYLMECRLAYAMRLLTTCDLPVTDIGLSCGFGSTSYFSKVFREKVGITPLSYRKNR